MADSTLGCPARLVAGLDRSCGPLGMLCGREIAASLNRCSVNEALWCGIGLRGILVRKGRFGTIYGKEGFISCLFLYTSSCESAVVETSFSSLFGSFLTVKSNPVSFESSESSVAGLLLRPTKEFCGVMRVNDESALCGGDTGGVRSEG